MKHIDLSPFQGKAMTDADWQHLMMRILFTPRPTVPSYSDSLVSKAVKHFGLNAEQPDPLHAMLGFTKENLPEMTSDFNSAMGHLFETLVRIIFKLSNEALYNDNFDEAQQRLTPEELKIFKKIKSDCIFGRAAIEIKYRYGSSEGLTKQKEASKPLEKMGYKAVALCFRRSPNADEMRAAGWDVYEGQACIEYVQERTGVDINRVLSLAMANPLIAKRIEKLQQRYDDETKARLLTDFTWALDGHREPVHRLVVEDDESRHKFIDDVGYEDKLINGFLDDILKDAATLKHDERFKSLVAEYTNNKEQSSAPTPLAQAS